MQQPNNTSDATYFGYHPHDMGMEIGGSSFLTFPAEVSPTLPWALPHAFSAPFDLQKPTDKEQMEAKALAASKSHSEAERRRRERINNHLAKLRSLLPNTTKTDKASLLTEVIQHVKDLKRQTSSSSETFPSETDELTVDEYASPEDGWMIRASICCDDRSSLLPDLINTLKALRLRTLKAEITTLGGRVKNVLFLTDGNDEGQQEKSIGWIEKALRDVMESRADHVKRQRTTNNHID